MIDFLVLVAGPSGAGKSTFLRQLASGALSGDIASQLPVGAETWVQTDGRKVLRNEQGLRCDQSDMAGLCMHYDFLRPFESHISSYDADTSLGVLAHAKAVKLVMIDVAPQRLRSQLLGRSLGRSSRISLPSLRRQAIAGLIKLFGPEAEKVFCNRRALARKRWRLRHLSLVEYYQEPGWLAQRESIWLDYLATRLGSRLLESVVRVQPVQGSPTPAFALSTARDNENHQTGALARAPERSADINAVDGRIGGRAASG